MLPRSCRRTLVVILALGGLTDCNTTFTNPFTGQNKTQTPAASDDFIFASDSDASSPNGLAETFSASSSAAATLRRLTFCNTGATPCNTLEAAAAPDRKRLAVRRVTKDTNGDGVLTEEDGAAVVFVDLARSVEATLVDASNHVEGVDWSPVDGVIIYSAQGTGGVEDLFRMDTNGQNNQNLTSSAGIRERRPRIDPSGSFAVFERIDASGKGAIWIFNSSLSQVQVDPGGPGSAPLAGTPYLVGSDADPTFSPDGGSVAFRRLTSTVGLGTWDILTVKAGGSGLRSVVTGPRYRGAPDWNAKGIIFPELDPVQGTMSLVVVQPDGSGRSTPLTLNPGFGLTFPRWLAP
jgi:Tol biopolymer transport system component